MRAWASACVRASCVRVRARAHRRAMRTPNASDPCPAVPHAPSIFRVAAERCGDRCAVQASILTSGESGFTCLRASVICASGPDCCCCLAALLLLLGGSIGTSHRGGPLAIGYRTRGRPPHHSQGLCKGEPNHRRRWSKASVPVFYRKSDIFLVHYTIASLPVSSARPFAQNVPSCKRIGAESPTASRSLRTGGLCKPGTSRCRTSVA